MAFFYSNLPSTLQTYPELLLSIAVFFVFLLIRRSLDQPPLIRWPLLGHTPYLILNLHRLHDWLTDLLRLSGSTYLFSPPTGASIKDVVLTCDPANVNHVYNTSFSNFPKGRYVPDLFDFLGKGIFTSDGPSWRFQRRKAHALMSSPGFRAFALQSTMAKVNDSLVPLLDHFAAVGERTLDLQDVFMRLGFDVTCGLVFGVDPGCLGLGFPRVAFADAMDEAEEWVIMRYVLPEWLWRAMRRVRVGGERRVAEAVEVMDAFIEKNVEIKKNERKRGGGGGGHDLLSAYLDCEHEIVEEGGFYDLDKFLRDTALSLMVAGRDTESSALTWFFYLVAKNPNVEAKILQEVRQQKQLISGINPDLSKLIYLHAALCESLRLYPPVPFVHKSAASPDRLPSGVQVHKKRLLIFSMYSIGRIEAIWGKDCMEFRPERWILDTGKIRHEPSFKFVAFNTGPRTCLGKDIAFMQLKVVAATVIEKFRIRVVEGFVAKPKLSVILHMKGGLMVKVSRRED